MPIHLLQSYSKLPVTVINWRREDTCLWDDLDQDQLSKITCIMVRQMNQWVSRWIPQFFWCVMFWLISDTLILIRSSQWRHPECFLAFTKTRYMFFSQKLAERFFIAISHYRSIYLHGENLVIIIYLHYMYTYVKLITPVYQYFKLHLMKQPKTEVGPHFSIHYTVTRSNRSLGECVRYVC